MEVEPYLLLEWADRIERAMVDKYNRARALNRVVRQFTSEFNATNLRSFHTQMREPDDNRILLIVDELRKKAGEANELPTP